jgi:hypothetical protein
MPTRLQIELPPNWCYEPDADGPALMFRDAPDAVGSLQVSIFAEYKSGEIPNPTVDTLTDLAKKHGERNDAGQFVEIHGGACKMGTFGSAIFRRSEFPRVQFWYLSNGRDFVLATHVCVHKPTSAEIDEAQSIVEAIQLADAPNAKA